MRRTTLQLVIIILAGCCLALPIQSTTALANPTPIVAVAQPEKAEKKKEQSPIIKYAVPALVGFLVFLLIVKFGKKAVRKARKGGEGPNFSVKNSDHHLVKQVEEEHLAEQRAQQQPAETGSPSTVKSAQAPSNPPGWHPDPSDPNQLRWWDGQKWTDKIHAQSSTQQQKEGWYPDPQDNQQLRWWDGQQWTANTQPRQNG